MRCFKTSLTTANIRLVGWLELEGCIFTGKATKCTPGKQTLLLRPRVSQKHALLRPPSLLGLSEKSVQHS